MKLQTALENGYKLTRGNRATGEDTRVIANHYENGSLIWEVIEEQDEAEEIIAAEEKVYNEMFPS